MRALKFITCHVIFKLSYNQMYQLKTTKEYLHRMQRRLEEKIAENMTYHGISEESRRRSMSNDDEEEYEYEGNF